MQNSNNTSAPSTSSRLVKLLVTLACLGVVAAILWQLLPKASFSSDLTQVGQGRPTLVMLREIHVMGGEQVMEQMLQVYPDYEGDVTFLVVHTGHPDGQAFAATHEVGDGSLVLFDSSGNAVASMGRPGSAAQLRGFIDGNLATP